MIFWAYRVVWSVASWIWCIYDVPLRCNSIFYSKIHFVVGGHLGFWKGSFLTLHLSVRCPVEAPCQIWLESDQRFGRYSDLCKFQNGGRRPSWIMDFEILRPPACSGCRVNATYQIWCKSDEPFRSYSFFGKFQFFVGGHLGFWKITFLCIPLCGRRQGEARHTKFGKNQSNGSEVIEVFVNFKIAAPPYWIPLFSNFLDVFLF